MYAVNMELHKDGRRGTAYEEPIDVDEHYVSEMKDRAMVLDEDPLRCQSLPHMTLAGWDTLELLMTCKAQSYPEWFSLTRDGDRWHWINRPMVLNSTLYLVTKQHCRTDRLNTSRARHKEISVCLMSDKAICGWMLVWSPPRRTGHSTSI